MPMDFNAVVEAVKSLGVAVIMCLLMAWFVKYMFDKFMTELENEREAHKAEMTVLQEALANNTVALTTLTERLAKQ